MLKDLTDPHLLCVVDICGSDESRHDPVVFAAVAETIIPHGNAIRGKLSASTVSYIFNCMF